MRKTIWFCSAGLLALSACSQGSDSPAGEEEAAVADYEVAPGTYDVTTQGITAQVTMNDDGTYIAYDPDGNPDSRGTYAPKDGKLCFQPEAEGADEQCWKGEPPRADGSWLSRDDAGTLSVITPVEEEEAETEGAE